MNYELIKSEIKDVRADNYVSYLKKLESEKDKSGKVVNWWFKNCSEQIFIDLWNKAVDTGLYIDGDTVAITARGGTPMLSFDYHAYRNVVMFKYPETKFDQQLVYDGDNFSFRKESGKVIYSHTISNPFDTEKRIIGAYAVIKNSTGEFIDFVNMSDIEKMKKTSNMKSIWDSWLDRMVLKSVIKRICTVNFKDVVKALDTIDNENYDLEKLNQTDYDELVHEQVEKAGTYRELVEIYNKENGLVKNQKSLIAKISEVRENKFQIKHGTELYDSALQLLLSGAETINTLKNKYFITQEVEQKLKEDATNNL